jgi:L-histidine Nalpha-methyltransferase
MWPMSQASGLATGSCWLSASRWERESTSDPDASPRSWTALAGDVLRGLLTLPKTLPPKWFYDAHGSELFERITELDEYYLTRSEAALLGRMGAELVAEVDPVELVELGSGSSSKTHLVLDPIAATGRLERYMPVDVSAAAIEAAIPELVDRYPGVAIDAHVCDFTSDLGRIGPSTAGPRLVALLGSTIGNLQPVEVRAFLHELAPVVRAQDALLLGTDLVKEASVLEAAYDDPDGVTAAFNLNILTVINRELEADFDLDSFRHEALYNPTLERVEMRLRSTEAQVVRIEALGTEITFLEGEGILTEISRKFTHESVERAYSDGGFRMRAWHEDAAGGYALSLASPA